MSGVCLYCGEPGHFASTCPNKHTTAGALSLDTTTTVDDGQDEDEDDKDDVDDTTTTTTTMHMDMVPRPRVTPVTPVAARTRSRGKEAATTASVLTIDAIPTMYTPTPAWGHIARALVIKVECIEPAGEFDAKIDPAAEVSSCSRELALRLTLEIKPAAAPLQLKSRFSSTVSYEIAHARARLLPEAPVRDIQFAIAAAQSGSDYAIIGLPDLGGFVFRCSSPPAIEWSGPLLAETVSDPAAESVAAVNELKASTYEDVKLGEGLMAEQRVQVSALLKQYAQVFAPIDATPMQCCEFKIKLKPDAKPTRAPPRRFNKDTRDFIHAEVQNFVQMGILKQLKTPSPWGFPIAVPRNHGVPRLCGDFKALNDITVKVPPKIPEQRPILDFLCSFPLLSKFDMRKGFLQVKVAEETQKVLVIMTPDDGDAAFMRMPFGVSDAPGHFQEQVDTIFGDIKEIRAFIDDMGMGNHGFDDLMVSLKRVLDRCNERHIHLNGPKCTIGATEAVYLGRVCSQKGIAIDPASLEPLKNATAPKNKHMLQSFIGLTNWFADFVPHMATLVAPLLPLTHKQTRWTWTNDHEKVFHEAVAAITHANPLAGRDPNAPVAMQTDVSDLGLAGVLWQVMPDSSWRALCFYSRLLTDAERGYPTIEKEALAIVYCVDRARPFNFRSIVVVTDHSNLQWMRTSRNARIPNIGLRCSPTSTSPSCGAQATQTQSPTSCLVPLSPASPSQQPRSTSWLQAPRPSTSSRSRASSSASRTLSTTASSASRHAHHATWLPRSGHSHTTTRSAATAVAHARCSRPPQRSRGPASPKTLRSCTLRARPARSCVPLHRMHQPSYPPQPRSQANLSSSTSSGPSALSTNSSTSLWPSIGSRTS
jgi:hypothetical protein